jgi:hypothetical protein
VGGAIARHRAAAAGKRRQAGAGVMRKITVDFNRVVLACGRAAQTGDTRELDQLLDRIEKGLAKPLTPKETGTLHKYYAGKFNRKRGEWKSDKREQYGEETRRIVQMLKALKQQLKNDEAEKNYKREQHKLGAYSLDERTVERSRELMKQHNWFHIRSHDELLNALRGRGKKKAKTNI